jgi:eukaryotic-like serine/threonine-protein kinase
MVAGSVIGTPSYMPPEQAPRRAGSMLLTIVKRSVRNASPTAEQLVTVTDTESTETESRSESQLVTPQGGEKLPQRDPERYVIVREHGRGGLGRVLNARDREMDRTVALKELVGSDHRSDARFVREALITARLEHPAIVPVYEAGRWPSGKPYYAMKMVSGVPLKQRMNECETFSDRMALLGNISAVADAMAYAHSKGVIHRDLKPSNVMVGEFGETVVIDWGLAKDLSMSANAVHGADAGPYRLAAEGVTAVGHIVGTPLYMPPEQARGEVVDQRADVYAIGAMLYHLLSGEAPYQASSCKKLVGKVAAAAPPRPLEEVASRIPHDLVAIVRKAMAPDKADRYRNARELAEDLKRFQTGKLVAAHDYTTWQRIQRWLACRRVIVAASVVVVLVAVVSFAAVVQQRDQARSAQQREHQARAQVESRAADLVLHQARTNLDRDPAASLAWLRDYPAHGDAPGSALADMAADARARGFARYVLRPHKTVAFEAWPANSGRGIASVGADNLVVYTDLRTRTKWTLGITSDLGYLITWPRSDQVAFVGPDQGVHLVNISSREGVALDTRVGIVSALGASHNRRWLFAGGIDGILVRWELEGNRILRTDRVALGSAVTHAEASDEGGVVVCTANKALTAIDRSFAGASRIGECDPRDAPTFRVAPSGNRVIVAATGGGVGFIDSKGSAEQYRSMHDDTVATVAISDDGLLGATASWDGTAVLFDAATGQRLFAHRHKGRVYAAAISADHAWFASGDERGAIIVTHVPTGVELELRGHTGGLYGQMAFYEGALITPDSSGEVRVWALPAVPARSVSHRVEACLVRFLSSGALLSGGGDHLGRVSGPAEEVVVLNGHEDRVCSGLEIGPGHLVTGSWDGSLRFWRSGEVDTVRAHKGIVRALGRAPSGRWIASGGGDGRMVVVDADSRRLVASKHVSESPVRWLAFSPDGHHLFGVSDGGDVVRWNWPEGESILLGTGADVRAATFEGGLILVARVDGTVDFYGETGHLGADKHKGSAVGVARTGDGQRTVSVSERGAVHLYSGTSVTEVMYLSEGVDDVRLSDSGRWLAAAYVDGSIHMLDLDARQVVVLRGHNGLVFDLTFDENATHLATAGVDGRVLVWGSETWLSPQAPVPFSPERLRLWLAGDSTTTARILDNFPITRVQGGERSE